MINRTLEKILDIKSADLSTIFGIGDSNLKLIRSEIPVDITARREKIKIIGEKDDVIQASQIFIEMIETLNSKGSLDKEDVRNLISMIKIKVNKNIQKGIVRNIKYVTLGKVRLLHRQKDRIYTLILSIKMMWFFVMGLQGLGKPF